MEHDNKLGYQLGQVRLIFQASDVGVRTPFFERPLAYIQWFSKLRKKDPLTNMFIISRQLDGDNRLGEVVDISRFTRRVELIPRFGIRAPDEIDCNSSMELDHLMYSLNSFLDKETYQAVY